MEKYVTGRRVPVRTLKYIFEDAHTRVKSSVGMTEDFPVTAYTKITAKDRTF